jgi:tRNA threonylcarbamoyladenosine biosynthesis protein TsaB
MLLAIETATDRAQIALGSPGTSAAVIALARRDDLSRQIDTAVRDLLGRRDATAGDIAGVVVADGPGSFTGLRIGLAFAKGFCRAAGVPLYAAASMLAAALRAAPAGRGGLVLVDYDALRGEVYRGAWVIGAAIEMVAAPALSRADAPLVGLPARPDARADQSQASAEALLALVGVRGGARRVEDPAAFAPDYGRPAEAEARRLARGG